MLSTKRLLSKTNECNIGEDDTTSTARHKTQKVNTNLRYGETLALNTNEKNEKKKSTIVSLF
ncbi:hypothetical protein OAG1_15600 [Agarivorans sp. OAG1]|nr:hypothetical protein OAG1_15600 [Agarivorans sp. OAG1]